MDVLPLRPWEAMHRPQHPCPHVEEWEDAGGRQFLICETRRFGPIVCPRSLEELIRYVRTWNLQREEDCWLWRGQADYRWPLDPGAVRRLKTGLQTAYWGTPEARVREYEDELLDHARLTGHGSRPDRRELSDLELLAVLQHNGAATRLLDFTSNMLMALWFAAREAPQIMGALVCVRTAKRLRASDLQRPLGELLDEHGETVLRWAPEPLSARMLAQQSILAFAPTCDEVWGALPLQDVAIIGVPVTLKAEALCWGRVLLGYSQESLFPGSIDVSMGG